MRPSFRYLDGGYLSCRNCGMSLMDDGEYVMPEDLRERCRAGTCRDDVLPGTDLMRTAIEGCYLSRRSAAEIAAEMEQPS
jgi:hypothetical protein